MGKWKAGYNAGYELGFEAGKRTWQGGRTITVLDAAGAPLFVFVAPPGQTTAYKIPENIDYSITEIVVNG